MEGIPIFGLVAGYMAAISSIWPQMLLVVYLCDLGKGDQYLRPCKEYNATLDGGA
jgi:hypothetical protein